MKLVIAGILVIICAILLFYAMISMLIKDMRIRRNSRKYEGIITGSYTYSHVKTSTSFYPYIEVKALDKTLKCVRPITFLFKSKEMGYYKKINIVKFRPRSTNWISIDCVHYLCQMLLQSFFIQSSFQWFI